MTEAHMAESSASLPHVPAESDRVSGADGGRGLTDSSRSSDEEHQRRRTEAEQLAWLLELDPADREEAEEALKNEILNSAEGHEDDRDLDGGESHDHPPAPLPDRGPGSGPDSRRQRVSFRSYDSNFEIPIAPQRVLTNESNFSNMSEELAPVQSRSHFGSSASQLAADAQFALSMVSPVAECLGESASSEEEGEDDSESRNPSGEIDVANENGPSDQEDEEPGPLRAMSTISRASAVLTSSRTSPDEAASLKQLYKSFCRETSSQESLCSVGSEPSISVTARVSTLDEIPTVPARVPAQQSQQSRRASA
eukprot:gb/GFBE01030265.1/.p1 GENE.gb/GFBE01030265.1/~~gb/GFBE01030265.1/.p1  ORF type:complete len:310 (+),score=22.18 gb/GFBE01030265.1/:1-930(+)